MRRGLDRWKDSLQREIVLLLSDGEDHSRVMQPARFFHALPYVILERTPRAEQTQHEIPAELLKLIVPIRRSLADLRRGHSAEALRSQVKAEAASPFVLEVHAAQGIGPAIVRVR